LTRQIPWVRAFVKGVVIVGSILLAFGIETARGCLQCSPSLPARVAQRSLL